MTLCKNRQNDTRFADYNDCHKFYVCANGMAHEYNCDDGYHFDQFSLTCKEGGDCQNKEVPSECSDGSVRAVEGDCYIYQSCVNGQYQNIKCHIGYYFDASKLACKPILYNANYKCNCVVPDHTVMSNYDNCETYYLCEDGEAILTNCPLGEYYNATYNSCLPDLDAICLMEPTKSPLLKIKSHVEKLAKNAMETMCQNVGNDQITFYASDSDCNQFFVCANGQLHIQKCPQNFYFDDNKKFCVFDSNQKCQQNGQLSAVETPTAAPMPKIVVSPQEIASGHMKS